MAFQDKYKNKKITPNIAEFNVLVGFGYDLTVVQTIYIRSLENDLH